MRQLLTAARLQQLCGAGAPLSKAIIDQLALLRQPREIPEGLDSRLFATQTYYALLTKLLTSLVGYQSTGRRIESPRLDDPSLRRRLEALESGEMLVQRGISMPSIDNPYAWNLTAWNDDLANAISALWHELGQFELATCRPAQAEGRSGDPPPDDLLKAVYHRLIPREVRHARGEYYTPHWLARYLLERLEFPGASDSRLLDPACGSGTFLLEAIACVRNRCQQQGLQAEATLSEVLARVVGIDLDPLAVLAARANYLLAIADLLPRATDPITIPVYQADSILAPPTEVGQFDVIAGNPPWIGWESLGEEYRQQTRPLWEQYGLFAHTGMSTILGSGKKDLSLLMSYAVTDRLLKPGGRLGFIITQSAFKTLEAGQGFRQFAWTHEGETTAVKVERVEDLTDFQPFEIAGTRTTLFVWKKGEPTEYPVSYRVWQKTSRGKSIASDATLAEALSQTRRLEYEARPIESADSTSCWLSAPAGVAGELERLWGASPYQAHEGANTGGANGVYWLEVLQEAKAGRCLVQNIVAGAKKQVPRIEAEIEAELLYPLLRGREVRRWLGQPRAMLLMVQDPQSRRGYEQQQFAADFPLAYHYLQSFEPMLRQRAAFRRYFTCGKNGSARETGPFYSMFNIGPATFAPWKVVWHRMVAPLGAVVVGRQGGKPILPQETHAFVACDSEQEAFYLAGLMNSTVFNYAAMSFSQAGGKSFASPKILRHLHLPRFRSDEESHVRVARIASSRQRHHASSATRSRAKVPRAGEFDPALDRAAAAVWRMSPASSQRITRAMHELTKADLA